MLTCQKLRISAECWTSIGSSCHFFISFVVHIVSTCQTSARPELDFRDWTRETSETRDFQACCGRVMRIDTCKDAHILKRFSKSFRHIGAFWNFPSARGSEADQFSQLQETTTHTSMMEIGKGRRSISSGGLVARRHKTLVTSPNHSIEDLNMYLKPIGNL